MHDRTIQKATSEGWTDLEIINGQVWGYRNSADVMPQPYKASFPSSSTPARILELIDGMQLERRLRDTRSFSIANQDLESLAEEFHQIRSELMQRRYCPTPVRTRPISAILVIDGKHMQGQVARFQSTFFSYEHFECDRVPRPLIGKLEDRYRINDYFSAELVLDGNIENSIIRNIGILNFSINLTQREIIATVKIALL